MLFLTRGDKLTNLARLRSAYVGRFAATTRATRHKLTAVRIGLTCIPPNYAFIPKFRPGDVVIDVGTGDDPDLSKSIIATYGLECYAVDPTHKHANALQELERQLPGFHYLPYALGARSGEREFHESTVNVSGSLLPGHRNVVNDPTVSYMVDVVTLEDLLRIIGAEHVALMKIDIEGAEYDLVQCLDAPALRRIKQLIVEFHHDIVSGIVWEDTQRAIAGVKKCGMKAFVYNGRDCLFYW